MGKEAKTTEEKPKIRPFNVMDQTAAHRLALEGFEILNVIPSNKYADEAHFIFCFNATNAFKKRFKEIIAEVESQKAVAEDEQISFEELLRENEKLKSENAELLQKLGENSSKNSEKNAENEEKTGEKQVFSSDNSDILDALARLEALGNCILSNVSAVSFFERLHNKIDKEG